MTTDDLRARAMELGRKAAAAGLSDLDNPYINATGGLAELWATGYSSYIGAMQVLCVEAERLNRRAA